MKAAVCYEANQPLQVVDVELEGPHAGEARVRVKATGVCHSDWHIINGDWTPPLPMVLGHEAAGIVEAVGAGVTSVKPGDHVIFSFRPQCGRCFYCSIGRPVLCDGYASPRWVMLDGTYRVRRNGQPIHQLARLGTFAEQVVCPAEMLVPMRKEMPWAQAALLGCAVPTGVGAVTRAARVEAGSSVLVIGCGGVGLNVVQGARLVRGVEDILEELHLAQSAAQEEARRVVLEDPQEAALLEALSFEPRHVDEVGRECDLPAAVVSSTLTVLELKGLVRHVGGMQYVRV